MSARRLRYYQYGDVGLEKLLFPLDGIGDPVTPTGPIDPVDPVPEDWRARTLMLPDADKVVWGFSPTVGTIGQLESLWGAQSGLVRIYGGQMTDLPGLMNTCQNALNAGRVPVLDFNTSVSFTRPGIGWRAAASTGQGAFGKDLWQAQADGDLDSDGVGPSGGAYKGFDSMLLAVKGLNRGLCPTNRIILSKDHEFESMNEGGGDGKNYGEANATRSGTQPMFRAAWHRMLTRANALGVDNVIWLFNAAGQGVATWGEGMTDGDTFGSGSNGYYPGHKWVDIVGWDPYNAAGLREAKWRYFDATANGMLNKFGQLDWWKRNYRIDGLPTLALAQAAGHSRVFKPAMLPEFGTMDSWQQPGGTLFTAAGWATGMVNWLANPVNQGIFKWLLYYNNVNMTILNDPSYRRTEFAGKGAHSVWQ